MSPNRSKNDGHTGSHTRSKQLKQNKGSAGVDGMKVTDRLSHLREHGPELVQAIKEGSYKPQPVLLVLIPKANSDRWGSLR